MRQAAIMAAALLAAATELDGCGHSPPTRFFTLDPMPPSRSAPPGPITPVQLYAVHIPAVLDRPQVVSQTAANRLEVSDQDRWGASLGDMMRRTLAQDLLERLPSGAFLLPDSPKAPGARGLEMTVLQLRAGGGSVRLQGSWTLLTGTPSRPALTRNFDLSEDARETATDKASAISRLLGRLADGIAAALASGEPPSSF